MNYRFESSCKSFNLFIIGGHNYKKIFIKIEEQNRVSIIRDMLCPQHFHISVRTNSKLWVVTVISEKIVICSVNSNYNK